MPRLVDRAKQTAGLFVRLRAIRKINLHLVARLFLFRPFFFSAIRVHVRGGIEVPGEKIT